MSRKNGGIIGPANTPVGGVLAGVAGGVWRMNDVANFVSNNQWPKGPENIDNSLRFDDDSSDYLNITPSSAGNRQTCTFSAWIKRSDIVNANIVGCHSADNDNDTINIIVRSNGELRVVANSVNWRVLSRLFRDVSAWYHIVVAFDTTQSTANDRIKVYINGTQETSFSTTNNPDQNANIGFNQASTTRIGVQANSLSNYFDGYMAEVVFIDGLQLDPTSFGEFDTTTGIWKPKKIGKVGTVGANTFYLNFKDSSNVGKDLSGKNNNFTVNNLTSIDQSTDTCVENFATMNPIAAQAGSSVSSSVITFTEGNLVVDAISSETAIANFGVDTGKWYWEVKVLTDQDGLAIGAANQHFHLDAELGYNSPSSPSDAKVFGYYGGNGNKFTTIGDGSQLSSYGDAIAVNDIIGVALNLDDDEVIFYKNGTAQNSGTAISLTALGSGEQYFPAVGNWSGSAVKLSFNFGSPQFSISSGNADANGHGNFEYSVPSGYFALNTSNLNTYG